ncbi:MAG: hypothetical protein AAB408_04635 [Patescibacteria group bacterium]
MPDHYICRGCKNVFDEDGLCGVDGCAKQGDRLEFCDCPNGWHKGAFEESEWEPIESH